MENIRNAARVVFDKCFNIKHGEKVLIITDEKKRDIANIFFHVSKEFTNRTGLIEMPEIEHSGQEPPQEIAQEMKKSGVVLLITSKSLSHTRARKRATRYGARIASLPGLTNEMAHALIVDYDKLKEITKKLADKLEGGRHVMVKNDKGTDLILNIKERKLYRDNGDLTKPKNWGNLPAGEVCVSPRENFTNGLLVADISIAGIGKLKQPVKIMIERGFITEIKGGEQANLLAKMLADVKSELAYNIAEFGIGVNDKARITGHVLEDEKVVGTAHIAIGNNTGFGGRIDVPIHLDCVISKPTIIVDGTRIMEDGEFLLDKKGLWWKLKP